MPDHSLIVIEAVIPKVIAFSILSGSQSLPPSPVWLASQQLGSQRPSLGLARALYC